MKSTDGKAKKAMMGLVLGALFALAAPAGAQYYDQSGNCGSAEQLWDRTSATGAIQFDRDVDVFEINVGSGTLVVETEGTTDTFGTLLSSSYGCPAIVSNDDDGFNYNFYIVRPVTAGKYFIAIRHFSPSGRGEYTLHYRLLPPPPPPVVPDEHGNTCATATAVPLHDDPGTHQFNYSVRGVLGPDGGDVDMFRIDVDVDVWRERYLVELDRICAGDDDCKRRVRRQVRQARPFLNFFAYTTINPPDLDMTVYDAQCRPIAESATGGTRPPLEVRTRRRETFYVEIRHSSPIARGHYGVTASPVLKLRTGELIQPPGS